MENNSPQAKFEVIESFAIKSRNEFYLIGSIIQGTIQENYFIHIPFNNSLAMTIRINGIEEVEISGNKIKYNLLIISSDTEIIDLLLALHIESETLTITMEGED